MTDRDARKHNVGGFLAYEVIRSVGRRKEIW